MPKACQRHANGMPMACQWQANGMPIACQWHANGMPMACQWHANVMPMACQWPAPAPGHLSRVLLVFAFFDFLKKTELYFFKKDNKTGKLAPGPVGNDRTRREAFNTPNESSDFFKSRNEHFCKNTNNQKNRPRDQGETIELGVRLLMHLTRAP